MPQRIQRRRTAGWRMPEGAVYVGQPTRWGNPYRVLTPLLVEDQWGNAWYPVEGEAAGVATRLYREDLLSGRLDLDPTELRGLDLACWCPPDSPCHADVLLYYANRRAS